MIRPFAAILVLGVVLAAAPAWAHHVRHHAKPHRAAQGHCGRWNPACRKGADSPSTVHHAPHPAH